MISIKIESRWGDAILAGKKDILIIPKTEDIIRHSELELYSIDGSQRVHFIGYTKVIYTKDVILNDIKELSLQRNARVYRDWLNLSQRYGLRTVDDLKEEMMDRFNGHLNERLMVLFIKPPRQEPYNQDTKKILELNTDG